MVIHDKGRELLKDGVFVEFPLFLAVVSPDFDTVVVVEREDQTIGVWVVVLELVHIEVTHLHDGEDVRRGNLILATIIHSSALFGSQVTTGAAPNGP